MAPPTSAATGTLQAPDSGVTVRMYNPGYGDCFLLAFRGDDSLPRYMLIDCGGHQNHPKSGDQLKKIAQDIVTATGNHLHVVVLTHEHVDHVSGFYYGRDHFQNIPMDQLWLGWPENQQDPDYDELMAELGKKAKQSIAFRAAAEQLKSRDPESDALAEAILSILAFESDDLPLAAGLLGISRTKKAQYDFLKAHVGQDPLYLAPDSDPITLPWAGGIRIYALGPPRDMARLRVTEPPDKTHLGLAPLDESAAFALAVLAAAGEDSLQEGEKEAYWRSLPFERRSPYRVQLKDLTRASERAESDTEQKGDTGAEEYLSFFCDHYGLGDMDENAWRRIDTDWLAATLQVVLRQSDWVNNTSLVMAMELVDSGRVLLFAGDAQAGNWLSWKSASWTLKHPGGTEETVTGRDLIANTVFYKVGHHGSHNATLTEYVGEMRDDLIAMISVDEAWARGKAGPWLHPDPGLETLLIRETSGRLVRSDKGVLSAKPDGLSPSEWQDLEDYVKDWSTQVQCSPDGLWFQCTIEA